MSDETANALAEILGRLGHALVNEFGSQSESTDSGRIKQYPSGRIKIPDDVSKPVATAIQEVADKVTTALNVQEQVIEEATESEVKDNRIGLKVQVESKGIQGTIVSRKSGWLVVSVSAIWLQDEWEPTQSTRTVSVRWNECEVLDMTPKPTEEVPEPKVPEVQSDTHVIDNDGPGAYRIEVGIHTGKSIHEIYVDAENGDVFLKYLAKKDGGPYSDEAKKAAREYLDIRGINWNA
jgi:hypothetical protein